LVAHDKFRFDFGYHSQPTVEQVAAIESEVKSLIEGDYPVLTRVTSLADAKAITGLRAVFGETYPDPVRVVAVGPGLSDLESVVNDSLSNKWMNASLELCGGTHVASSADIRDFLIISEGAISKGSRRIVAVTGDAAAQARILEASLVKRLNEASSDESIKSLTKDLDEAQISMISKTHLRDRLNNLRKELIDKEKTGKQAQAKAVTEELLNKVKQDNSPFMVARVNVGDNQKAITSALNALQAAGKHALLYSVADDKVFYQSMVANDAFDGRELAKAFEAPISGRSGGKKASAQGSAVISTFTKDELASKLFEAGMLASALFKMNLKN
jgi:alanyl-tRNA synthetase